MPIIIENQKVIQVDGDPEIVRYIDLTKFLSMLVNQSLFFVRVDKLYDDPYEGTFSKPVKNQMREFYNFYNDTGFFKSKLKSIDIENNINQNFNQQYLVKSLVVVNCWHIYENENALM